GGTSHHCPYKRTRYPPSLLSQSGSATAIPSVCEQHGPLPLLRLSNHLLSSGRLLSCAGAAKVQTSSTISVVALLAAVKSIFVIAISLHKQEIGAAISEMRLVQIARGLRCEPRHMLRQFQISWTASSIPLVVRSAMRTPRFKRRLC